MSINYQPSTGVPSGHLAKVQRCWVWKKLNSQKLALLEKDYDDVAAETVEDGNEEEDGDEM
ncbi:Tubulin alpha-13 chain, putative [Trichomonas vaginalis G3]|uniref:Tubulin alpha-13 chain, putative n=1 Tax=Trichomonas vaginalis (strain ATCC PRA-98 / G3) TaxID=412133 RepID=A2F4F5_TRIV3|nr:structural constituent of cytoskeleton [Trichomonas vaginalis G3]EAY00220.1 Tubulin alpha-13 chain, putative [Trichomonas vaginalis G3]KAI5492890.1 structural constituent of cytoskeleton [Trichomonas vaginalis G3]|eukprot:XP_001313149.1 Tubulin alpha-13 chain [Trichomonas vaginalis G3]